MKEYCIEWTGAVNSGGYPVSWKDGKTVYAHRLIAEAKEGEVVMHTCDNPRCINPTHLQIGTHKENSEDMVRKGRSAKGEDTGNAKLTTAEVLFIRTLQGSQSSRKVAGFFNISKSNVLDIWNRKIWSHI